MPGQVNTVNLSSHMERRFVMKTPPGSRRHRHLVPNHHNYSEDGYHQILLNSSSKFPPDTHSSCHCQIQPRKQWSSREVWQRYLLAR